MRVCSSIEGSGIVAYPVFAFINNISPRLMTFLISILPVSELRGAIPYALTKGGLEWPEAYIFAVLGNFLPVIPLLIFLERISDWLRRYPVFDRFFDWFFKRTKRKGKLIERFEALGLVLFVAIPLPVTGAWTGCAAAFLFKIPLRLAIPAVASGILIAGAVVTLASLGVISFWGI
ncbi:MAG: small multi-drug export protein [Candidatus Krumholzibacteriota bacterium]|nr:small multi-drug export protein [Candidatus Krumholzibacteriota bacterium]